MTSRPTRDQVRAQRQDLIDRAIAYMDATDTDALTRLLSRDGGAVITRVDFQRDPSLLRAVLADARPDDVGRFFGAYKAAQRILRAAGLYQYPS